MEEHILFSVHAIQRLNQRTEMPLSEIRLRLRHNVGVIVGEDAPTDTRYIVLWDSRKGAPLLLILKSEAEDRWEVVTLYHALRNSKYLRENIGLKREVIDQAHMREMRFKRTGTPEPSVRLEFLICSNYHNERHKIGTVPLNKFQDTFKGEAKLLVAHFFELGATDNIAIPLGATVLAEVVHVRGGAKTYKVLSSWTVE